MTKLPKELRDHIRLNVTTFTTYEKVREYAGTVVGMKREDLVRGAVKNQKAEEIKTVHERIR